MRNSDPGDSGTVSHMLDLTLRGSKSGRSTSQPESPNLSRYDPQTELSTRMP